MSATPDRRAVWASVVAALAAIAVRADDGVAEMQVVTPRADGYVIGDTITHTIRLDLGADYRLDEHSLPAAGRVDQWLELHAPTLHRRGREVEITLTYQLINVPEAPSALVVPRQTLEINGPDRSLPVFLPEWTFTATRSCRRFSAALPRASTSARKGRRRCLRSRLMCGGWRPWPRRG
jgi:hypothetical protein